MSSPSKPTGGAGAGVPGGFPLFFRVEEVLSPSLSARPLSKVSPWLPPSYAASLPWRHSSCPGSPDRTFSPRWNPSSFSAMATSAKRKQEETHLKMLREMTSLPANRKCFDCDQRGPTYVNMTVGSFVCTTCSGILWVSFRVGVLFSSFTESTGHRQSAAVGPGSVRSSTDLAVPLAR